MTRSHKSKRPSQSLLPHVDRRVPKYRPKNGQAKMSLAESMKVSGRGYGPLDELEERLEQLNPKQP